MEDNGKIIVIRACYEQSAEFWNFNYEASFGHLELKLDRLSAHLTNLKVMEAISVYIRCFILFFF